MAQEVKDVKEDVKDLRDLSKEPVLNYALSDYIKDDFKEFGLIRVYGTRDEPMFLAADVAKLLGKRQFKLEDCKYLSIGKHYHKMIISGVHSKDVIVLTEKGLYLLVAKSESKLSEKFMDYVFVVLKELRTKGSVTAEDAMKKYHELQQQMEAQCKQLDEQNKELTYQRVKSEQYYMQSFELKSALETKEQKNKLLERNLRGDSQASLLALMKEKYMKKFYITLIKPPKEIENEFEYNVADEDPNIDEEYVFSLHQKEPEESCGSVYVHKDMNVATVHNYLCEHGFGIKSKDGYYKNKYRATIELLTEIFDELAEKNPK